LAPIELSLDKKVPGLETAPSSCAFFSSQALQPAMSFLQAVGMAGLLQDGKGTGLLEAAGCVQLGVKN